MFQHRPQELPGFYWDSKKNKYYKITANHNGATSAHTQQSVAEAKRGTKRKYDEQTTQDRKTSGTIRRMYNQTLVNVSIRSRLGEINPKMIGAQLAEREISTMGRRLAQSDNNQRLTSFVVHNGDIYTLSFEMRGRFIVTNASKNPRVPLYNHPLPAHGHTTNMRCGIVAHDLLGLLVYVGNEIHHVPWEASTPGEVRLTYPRGTVFHDIAINAPSPAGEPPVVALAASTGPVIIPFSQNGSMGSAWKPGYAQLPAAEAMAVSFLDKNTLISGGRNGDVWLTDHRVGPGHSVLRLRHARENFGINGLSTTKRAGEIIVSGLKGAALYDLRWAPKPESNGDNRPATPSMVQYWRPDMLLAEMYGRGKSLAYLKEFDVCIIKTTLVCSRRDPPLTFGQQITFHHVGTGQVIPMPQHDAENAGLIENVQVARIREGPESVWVNSAQSLCELSTRWSGINEMRADGVPSVLNSDPFPNDDRQANIVELYDRGNAGPVRY